MQVLLVTSLPVRAGGRGPRMAVRLAVAAGGGLALAAAFPPVGAWPLTFVAVAALAAATRGLRGRTGALAGAVFGLAFLLPLLEWTRVGGVDAWVALCVLQASFYAALGAALALTYRLRAWPLAGAALWVAMEAARATVPFGGFPWGRLAFAHAATPLTGFAALGGAPLVTFAAALVGSLLAAATLAVAGGWSRRPAPDGQPAGRVGVLGGVGGGAALLGVAAAVLVVGATVPVPAGGARTVDVAVVQGDVPRPGVHFLGRRMAVLSNHADATERLAARVRAGRAPQPDLVIWPENSSDLDPYTQPDAHATIDAAVRAVDAPTLVGAVLAGPTPTQARNAGIVWSPRSGPGDRYVKRHPVPFGEYVPLRSLLAPFFDRLSLIPRDFAPGDRPGVLQVGPAVVGDVICFEVAYDSLMRDLPRGGAQVLVVQTNNATFGRTGQPEQQLAMSRLRAVEHGRAVLVAATSGISAVVAPDGRVVDQSTLYTPDLITASVPLRDRLTVADQVGALPEWALTAAGIAALVLAVASGRCAHREDGPARTSGTARPTAPSEPAR